MSVARAPQGALTRRSITSDRVVRFAGLYAVVAGAASFVIAPLLALSFFATESGAEELEVGSVSAWAEPARDLAGGLLTFASADSVYFTYLKSLMLVAPAFFVCAWAVRSRRPEPRSRTELWGWRVALTGYGLLALGVIVALPGAVLNVVFFALIVPGLIVATIGSTILGIGLLRASYRPRLTPWLLSLSVPFWLVGSDVLGHNSLGLLPLFVAWGASGWRLWRR